MNNSVHVSDALELEVPPFPEFVGTARLFAAEATRHLGATEETVADLKIAISEACTGAIEVQQSVPQDDPVRLSIEPLEDSVKVEVRAAAGFDRWSEIPEPADGLGLGLVRALFPKAEFLTGDGGSSTLRIMVPLDEEL